MTRRLAVVLFALPLTVPAAHAQSGFQPLASSFQPRVPVSLLGSLGGLANRFDPSRFHMSSTITVGSGYGGSGTGGLQVTSFSYQFRSPVAMSVRVGHAFGAGATNGSGVFLQGLDLS